MEDGARAAFAPASVRWLLDAQLGQALFRISEPEYDSKRRLIRLPARQVWLAGGAGITKSRHLIEDSLVREGVLARQVAELPPRRVDRDRVGVVRVIGFR
jgi:hypothetical protein